MNLGNGIEINFSRLTDEQLQSAKGELEAAGAERGLWVPEGAGTLAVAQTIEIPGLREQLLATVEEGANLFNGAVEYINNGRKKKNQIPFTPAGEYRERAQDWLTDGRLKASAELPATDARPRIIIPRLSRPITTEEVLDSWRAAANGQQWSWLGRMKFLKNWSADQLSGFEPDLALADQLEVIPTAYDEDRDGTVVAQKTNLKTLQEAYPELDVATIFDGSVLARRYMNQSLDWRDSHVRGITLTPTKVGRFDHVPSASVDYDGRARVDASGVDGDDAARLRVR